MVKTTFFSCNKITLSGVEAPDVIPIVMGPSGRKFSFSTNSPCYCKVTLEQFKDKNLEKRRGTGAGGGGVRRERERKWEKDLKFNIY